MILQHVRFPWMTLSKLWQEHQGNHPLLPEAKWLSSVRPSLEREVINHFLGKKRRRCSKAQKLLWVAHLLSSTLLPLLKGEPFATTLFLLPKLWPERLCHEVYSPESALFYKMPDNWQGWHEPYPFPFSCHHHSGLNFALILAHADTFLQLFWPEKKKASWWLCTLLELFWWATCSFVLFSVYLLVFLCQV